MDWNWFFSAVSQSTAAIVGIFAAFIITKIVNNKTLFDGKASAVNEHICESTYLQAQLDLRPFDWYNDSIRKKDQTKLRNEVRDLVWEHRKSDPVFYYFKLGFSEFEDHKPIVMQISEIVKYNLEEIAEEEKSPSRPVRTTVEDNSPLSKMLAFSLPDPPFVLPPNPQQEMLREERRREIERERELIDKLLLQVGHQTDKNKLLVDQIRGNPESSSLVTFSIAAILILFYVGVIYPLSFMPLEPKSSLSISFAAFIDILFSLKGIILAAISIVFNAIIVMFFFTNMRLKYNKESIERLKRYTDPHNYSEYIALRDENMELFKSYQ